MVPYGQVPGYGYGGYGLPPQVPQSQFYAHYSGRPLSPKGWPAPAPSAVSAAAGNEIVQKEKTEAEKTEVEKKLAASENILEDVKLEAEATKQETEIINQENEEKKLGSLLDHKQDKQTEFTAVEAVDISPHPIGQSVAKEYPPTTRQGEDPISVTDSSTRMRSSVRNRIFDDSTKSHHTPPYAAPSIKSTTISMESPTAHNNENSKLEELSKQIESDKLREIATEKAEAEEREVRQKENKAEERRETISNYPQIPDSIKEQANAVSEDSHKMA